MGKYQRLEKEKEEAVKRYQELLFILIEKNIGLDDNPFSKIITNSDNDKSKVKDIKE